MSALLDSTAINPSSAKDDFSREPVPDASTLSGLHSSPRYSTTSRTETRLARHLFTHWGAPRPTLILTTCSPNAETSATTVDSAHRFISTPFAPDRLCVNNQLNRQKIDHDRSFDTNAARQLPRHLTQQSEQSRKKTGYSSYSLIQPHVLFELRKVTVDKRFLGHACGVGTKLSLPCSPNPQMRFIV